MQNRKFLFLILHFLLFVIPVNIYMIGDWLGTGIQWILFRYQSTYLGDSLFTFLKDLHYVLAGVVGGKTAIAWGIWTLGAVVLVVSLALHLLNYSIRVEDNRVTGILVIAGSALLLIADCIQYGILLHGPAGFCIPLGIPLLIGFGWLLYRESEPVSFAEWRGSLKSAFS